MSPTGRWMIAIALCLLSLTSLVTAQDQGIVDFHYYPVSARDCLYEASNTSTCDYSSVPIYNACLCSNGGAGFLDLAASCIGADDANDLTIVYNVLSANCAHSKTPIVYSLQQWLQHSLQATISPAAGSNPPATSTATNAHTTSTMATVTTASTGGKSAETSTGNTGTIATSTAASGGSSSSGSNNSGGSGNNSGSKLSTGAIAGIAIGSAAALGVAAGALILCCLRNRKKRTAYTAAPMHAGVYGGKEKEVAYTSYQETNASPTLPVYAHRAPLFNPPIQGAADVSPQGHYEQRDSYIHGNEGAAELQDNIEPRHELPP